MCEEGVQKVIEDSRIAASNAIETEFDGVEIHGGCRYLPDQFLQDTANRRTAFWGDSIENRARFPLEVAKATAQVIGSSMGMDDPIIAFTNIIQQLRTLNIGFLELIEGRIRGNDDVNCGGDTDISFAVRDWGKEAPVMVGGGFNGESAQKAVDEAYGT